MKTLLVVLTMFGLLSFSPQGQNSKEVNDLLGNQQTRQEIFRAIQGNQALMTEFMQEMNGNQQAMMWYGNAKFMNQEYMLNMMQNNPEFMQQMMNSIIGASAQDSTWSNQMINQMEQYPQMMQMMRYHANGMTGTYGHGMMMGGNSNAMFHSSGDNK